MGLSTAKNSPGDSVPCQEQVRAAGGAGAGSSPLSMPQAGGSHPAGRSRVQGQPPPALWPFPWPQTCPSDSPGCIPLLRASAGSAASSTGYSGVGESENRGVWTQGYSCSHWECAGMCWNEGSPPLRMCQCTAAPLQPLVPPKGSQCSGH